MATYTRSPDYESGAHSRLGYPGVYFLFEPVPGFSSLCMSRIMSLSIIGVSGFNAFWYSSGKLSDFPI